LLKRHGQTDEEEWMRARKIAPRVLALVVSTFWLVQAFGQTRAIDTHNSKLIVHVSKTGAFSAFADNHEVEAPIAEGFVDEGTRQVKFVVESQRLKVLDPQMSPDKRQQVQKRMLGPEVLDVAHFPRITFESTGVEQAGSDRLLVRGQLSLHGVTRPVVVNVRTENGRYVGSSTLKQREFGITPISIAGGSVKVKDELKIEFDVRVSPQAGVVSK
jgi:polyisoprenoid-binding protein YceI